MSKYFSQGHVFTMPWLQGVQGEPRVLRAARSVPNPKAVALRNNITRPTRLHMESR